jgi:hypothetical protein
MNTTTNTIDDKNITNYIKEQQILKLYKNPKNIYLTPQPQLTTPNKYKNWINNNNYIPIGLLKSLCGNDLVYARELKPNWFKPINPKVIKNTNIIVNFIGK